MNAVLTPSGRQVLVAYASLRGHTRAVAESIADGARAEGHRVMVKPLAEVGSDDIRDADVLFFGTWVQGFVLFGAGPARSARRSLQSLPELDGKPVGVFCTYLYHPRGTLPALRGMLEAKRARIVGEKAFSRRRLLEGAAEYAHTVMAASGTPVG